MRFRLLALGDQVTIHVRAEAPIQVPAEAGPPGPTPVHSCRWDPIRDHPSSRGRIPNPSYCPTRDPSSRPGTTAGTGRARLERRLRPDRPILDRQRRRLLLRRCVRSFSLARSTQHDSLSNGRPKRGSPIARARGSASAGAASAVSDRRACPDHQARQVRWGAVPAHRADLAHRVVVHQVPIPVPSEGRDEG